MKKILITLIIITFYNCSTTKKVNDLTISEKKKKIEIIFDYTGEIDKNQLDFIKANYNWKNEKILIINYSQPISSCHFDNNTITNTSIIWWKDFYSKINTEDCLNIEVLANGERVKGKLDNIKYFDDKNDFLYDNFFSRKKTCFGIMVVKNDGFYIQYNGHYSERQVAKFIEIMKK